MEDNICTACNGSGHYDTNNSPICSCCNGTGYVNPELDKIKEAKKILAQNGYTVLKLSKQQDIDSHECAESNGSKDCDGCSCRICLFEDI